MGNRHLLWHGTNVAVVAAILKSGLRISTPPDQARSIRRMLMHIMLDDDLACASAIAVVEKPVLSTELQQLGTHTTTWRT